ncbi:mechanosensitive ion channel family protein [bacterium]|nr:mechanosensitive ion channel family protein [bacterium]
MSFETVVSYLKQDALVFTLLKILLVFSLAYLFKRILQFILLRATTKLTQKTHFKWDDLFVSQRFFRRAAQYLPCLIVFNSAAWISPPSTTLYEILIRGCQAYFVIVSCLVVFSLISVFEQIAHKLDALQNKPIKSVAQALKVVVVFISIILILSLLLGKSPLIFLSGLGAMTAVLLLVFKDTILGLVASIQLSSLDMVRKGDWIEMPKYGADGDVTDVSLTTIRVQNWDKTITTIPAYALISDSFKNWRGMQESKGRRIKRSILIDISSIHFLSQQDIEKLKNIAVLKDYLERKEQELGGFERSTQEQNINNRQLTNIGTFRAYIIAYLKTHPDVNQNMTFLVRQLQPSSKGLPLEVYIFSSQTDWIVYENIQSDIFDHLLACISTFGLRAFQEPSGHDFQQLLKPNKTA